MERPPSATAPPPPTRDPLANLHALSKQKLLELIDTLNEMTCIIENVLITAEYEGHAFGLNERQLRGRLDELATEKFLVREAIEYRTAMEDYEASRISISSSINSGSSSNKIRVHIGHSKETVPLSDVLAGREPFNTSHRPLSYLKSSIKRDFNVKKKL
jgi:hypothetical protein